jgi:hypothetical protein
MIINRFERLTRLEQKKSDDPWKIPEFDTKAWEDAAKRGQDETRYLPEDFRSEEGKKRKEEYEAKQPKLKLRIL